MTDNHIVFVICGKVPAEELVQLPFSNPVSVEFNLRISHVESMQGDTNRFSF